MKNFICCIVLLCNVLACGEKHDTAAFFLPAEWEPQEAVWMGWDASLKDDIAHQFIANIINELQKDIDIVLWVTSDSLQLAALNFLTAVQVPLNRVEINRISADKVFWSRDISPVFVINRRGERKAIDFNYTGYFRYIKRLKDVFTDSIGLAREYQKVLKMMTIDSLMAVETGENLEKSWMFVEGGAIDVNGKGSLLVSEPFLFRNQSIEMRDTLTKSHFEEEFLRTLGVTNVIWLSDGLAEDGGGQFFDNYYSTGTNGHVDQFARFINESTILLAWVDEKEKDTNPMVRATYDRMTRNYKILKNARDPEGRIFNIIKLPMPAHIIEDRILDVNRMAEEGVRKLFENKGFKVGDTLKFVATSSYMNFIMTNGLIIIPSYIDQGTSAEREEQVENIFNLFHPDKKLLFIDATYVNSIGGGIHSITKQVPKRINL
ncbi:MAG: agmatine deiminase family protein [Cyclobacteriaceae bacterium]|nr:agmatine deiminase family protein [Cyclobacteriaceae bacterium]